MAKWIDGRRLLRGALVPLACLVATVAIAALAAGCGGAGKSRTTTGAVRRVVAVQHAAEDRWTYARARFRELCAGCHTLADAGATGHRFNLDHSASVEENHVRFAIAKGEPGMPAWEDVLSEREYEELAAYVVAVARRTRGDDYWQRQIRLRTEANNWTRDDTRRLEAYARQLRR